jgi:hypothetical protein
LSRGVQACIKNILAHVRVLDPNVPLEKLGEPTNNENTKNPLKEQSLSLRLWPAILPRSLRFRSFLLMMKLLARLWDAQMPPSLPCKDTLFKFYLVKNFFVI